MDYTFIYPILTVGFGVILGYFLQYWTESRKENRNEMALRKLLKLEIYSNYRYIKKLYNDLVKNGLSETYGLALDLTKKT